VNDWAASPAGTGLRRQLIDGFQQTQSSDRLGLTLLALLCHLSLLFDTPPDDATDETDYPLYLEDFDTLLHSQPRYSDLKVYEHMVLSLGRDFIASDDLGIYRFLATMLNIKTPVLGPLDGLLDQYWFRRRKGASHHDAYKEVRRLLLDLNAKF
jgi:hypothetical protein